MDKRLLTYKKRVQRLFSRYHSIIQGMDELHTLNSINELYSTLKKETFEEFLLIAKDYDGMTEEELNEILLGYNETTEYVYDNEFERKKSRLFESLIAAGALKSLFNRAFNLLWRQIVTYAINVVDVSRLNKMKLNGVKKVRWVTVEDEKTCEVCRERDGKIYPIGKIPSKHYNCCCYFEPIES